MTSGLGIDLKQNKPPLCVTLIIIFLRQPSWRSIPHVSFASVLCIICFYYFAAAAAVFLQSLSRRKRAVLTLSLALSFAPRQYVMCIHMRVCVCVIVFGLCSFQLGDSLGSFKITHSTNYTACKKKLTTNAYTSTSYTARSTAERVGIGNNGLCTHQGEEGIE